MSEYENCPYTTVGLAMNADGKIAEVKRSPARFSFVLKNCCNDELWLTVCPLLLGGATAPTPVEGEGFCLALAPRLELLSVQANNQEVFLHYLRQRLAD